MPRYGGTAGQILLSRASVKIRSLKPGDLDQWRRLWAAYLQFYKTSVSEQVYQTTFERLVSANEPDCRAHLAFVGNQSAGLVHCVYHANLWQIEKVCYLQDLYTVPVHRNKGVARALIEKVYREAESRGVQSVYWMTHETNAVARLLYDRIAVRSGFIEYCKD